MKQVLAPLTITLALTTGAMVSWAAIAQQPTPEPSPQPTSEPAPTNTPEPSPQPTPVPPSPDASEPSVINSVRYKCEAGKGFTADYLTNNTVRATFGSKVLVLPQVVSGSGIRYSDGNVTLRSKGDQAMVEVGNKLLFKNCMAVQAVEGRSLAEEPGEEQAETQAIEGLW
ncbi:MliC family protein [Leptothermofonsia sp. ETS-13]|uniref:MliC family protein n=1 Tax=Leptothermofonsia sp. ETS-13 TaxID=3035696 RepID=UPI003BA0488E